MSHTPSPRVSRMAYRAFLITAWLLAGLATAWLYLQWTDQEFRRDIRPFHAQPAADFRFTVTDSSDSWNWDWTVAHCKAAFTAWLAPRALKTLELRLVNPQDHDLDLPLRTQYQSKTGQTATAGAWCEQVTRGQTASLVCVAAPLAASDAAVATTALTGAVGQAVTYALNPNVFGEAQGRPWSWSQWQPLVVSAEAGDWRSACPTLSREVTLD